MSKTKEKYVGDSVTVTALGRLGRDPESRETRSGKRISSAPMGISQSKKNTAGHWEDDETMWLKLTAFGSDLDEFQKGDRVLVTGRLKFSTWEGRDGDRMQTWEILVNDATLHSKPKPKAENALSPSDEYPE